MLSVLISFRFPSKNVCTQEEIERVEHIFNYWASLQLKHDLDLVFINDHSNNFWLDKPYIHNMPGRKINWNMAAARNFAFSLSKGSRLLFTDIDHIISGDFDQLKMMGLENKYAKLNRISLINNEQKPLKHHTNTFIMQKKDFTYYDEDFCGNYGYEDTEFFYRLNKSHELIWIPQDVALAYVLKMPRPTLSRDKTINKKIFALKIGSDEIDEYFEYTHK